MTTPVCLRPRDAVGAAAAIAHLTLCTALVLGVAAACSSQHFGSSPLRWLGVALIVLAVPAGWALRFAKDPAHWSWALVPAGWAGYLAIASLTLRNPDLHVAMMLLFPSMYACRQLNRRPALVLLGLHATLIPLLALGSSQPRDQLFVALTFAPIMLAITVRLTVTGQRFDHQIAEARTRASTDALTNLNTRHTLEDALNNDARQVPSEGDALLVIDIDNFKQINDAHGHPAGDAVLVQLATVLLDNCRASDLPSRIGGDELAILYRTISAASAQRRADDIRAAVEGRIFVLPDGTVVHLTVSLGVVHSASGGTRFAELYEHADRALYRAKRAGRNAVVLHDAA